jgi:hypothetical protein
MTMLRRLIWILALGAAAAAPPVSAEDARQATLYRAQGCGCCLGYAETLKTSGMAVTVVDVEDLDAVKAEHAVPEALGGCHTTVIDGYVIEGHVPIAIVERLLEERPAIRGISLPGMPTGSPGMGGPKDSPFVVYEIGEGATVVYATE